MLRASPLSKQIKDQASYVEDYWESSKLEKLFMSFPGLKNKSISNTIS